MQFDAAFIQISTDPAACSVSIRSEVIFKKSSNHYGQLDLGVCYQ